MRNITGLDQTCVQEHTDLFLSTAIPKQVHIFHDNCSLCLGCRTGPSTHERCPAFSHVKSCIVHPHAQRHMYMFVKNNNHLYIYIYTNTCPNLSHQHRFKNRRATHDTQSRAGMACVLDFSTPAFGQRLVLSCFHSYHAFVNSPRPFFTAHCNSSPRVLLRTQDARCACLPLCCGT